MEPKVRNGKLVQKLISAAVAAIVGIATVLTIISDREKLSFWRGEAPIESSEVL